MHQEPEMNVVINDEGQYSIWPTFKPIPRGWREIGKKGTEQDCLNYIETIWKDMTPKSLRDALGGEADAATER